MMFRFKKKLDKDWEVIIIGGGPAGLTAALYLGRYKVKTLVITKEVGGLLNEASIIEDYPGIKRIKASELIKLFEEHAKEWGAEILIDQVMDIKKEGDKFIVKTTSEEFKAEAIILATGSERRKLKVPGENLSGVSYCAECDAPLFKDKIVAVVGGGNTAFHDALVLVNYAKKVYLIHRRDKFRADPILVEEAKRRGIEFILNKVVVEIKGEKKVEKIILKDTKTGEISELEVQGLFVAIGLEPNNELAKKLGVELDIDGRIKVDACMRTNVEGVFAAGDVTTGSCKFMQIITSAAEGAIAARSAYEYLLKKKAPAGI